MTNPILSTVFILTLFFGSFLEPNFQQKSTPKPDALTKKDSMLCKDWKPISSESFGVVSKITEKQKNDMASFSLEHKAKIIMEGVEKEGIWSIDRSKTYITFNVGGKTDKYPFRVMHLVPDTLILEYKDPNLIKTYYTYIKVQ